LPEDPALSGGATSIEGVRGRLGSVIVAGTSVFD
jgi:hypothetical protein